MVLRGLSCLVFMLLVRLWAVMFGVVVTVAAVDCSRLLLTCVC